MVASALTQIPLPAFPVAIVAAAGTTQATATPLTCARTVVTSGSGGVVLRPAATEVVVINRIALALNIYPPSGAKIDGGTVNAAVSVLVNATKRLLMDSTGQWWSA